MRMIVMCGDSEDDGGTRVIIIMVMKGSSEYGEGAMLKMMTVKLVRELKRMTVLRGDGEDNEESGIKIKIVMGLTVKTVRGLEQR